MPTPAVTSIGPGVLVQHGWALVVSPGATIGADVTLFHGVTIGQADSIAAVGGVRVGRGSRLMAGSLVTHDVPARSIVLGNPSGVVKSDCLLDVVNPVDPALFGRPTAAAAEALPAM